MLRNLRMVLGLTLAALLAGINPANAEVLRCRITPASWLPKTIDVTILRPERQEFDRAPALPQIDKETGEFEEAVADTFILAGVGTIEFKLTMPGTTMPGTTDSRRYKFYEFGLNSPDLLAGIFFDDAAYGGNPNLVVGNLRETPRRVHLYFSNHVSGFVGLDKPAVATCD